MTLTVSPAGSAGQAHQPGAQDAVVAEARIIMMLRTFKSLDDPLALSALRAGTDAGEPDPRRLPADLRGTPRLFQLAQGGQKCLLLHDNARLPGLYADTNGNESFSDEIRVSGTRRFSKPPQVNMPPLDRFGPVALCRYAGGPTVFVTVQGMTLKAWPASYLQGRGMVGGKSRLFALLDRNLNGLYDDVCPIPAAAADLADADGLFIDRNGNGRFERVAAGFWEVQPLTPAVMLDNIRFEVSVAPDGSAIELRPVDSSLGLLRVARDMNLLLLSDCGFNQLSRNDEWILPSGKYYGQSVSIISQRDREVFRYQAGNALGRLTQFEIEPHHTLNVPAGAGLRFQGTVAGNGDTEVRLVKDSPLRPGAVLEDDASIIYTAIKIKERRAVVPRIVPRPILTVALPMPVPMVYAPGRVFAMPMVRSMAAPGCRTSYG